MTIQLIPANGGSVKIGGRVVLSPAVGKLMAYESRNADKIALSSPLWGTDIEEPLTSFTDANGNTFANSAALFAYMVNFRSASVSLDQLAGAAFTGTVLPRDSAFGRFQVGAANSAAAYTLGANPVIGSWGRVWINKSGAAPTVTDGTLAPGLTFTPSTDMYLEWEYDGVRTNYFFTSK